MITCFLCNAEYDETQRDVVAEIQVNREDKPVKIKSISIEKDGRRGIAATCPACTRAAAFGYVMGSKDMRWDSPVVLEPEGDEE